MKKLRNTAQREAVYEAVVQLNPTHPTADEVMLYYSKVILPSVAALSTVI